MSDPDAAADPDVAARKAAARRAAFARRKAAHAADPSHGAAARARLLELIRADSDARVVAGYMPMRTEIDPLGVMAALVEEGRRVCVPVIVGPALPLIFREWTPDCALEEGPFGARIPASGAELTPGAVIAPLVAFDRRLRRLGYGGGFYDRTLARLRAHRPVLAVGFAYAAQEAEDLPADPNDQPLDAVVTEREVLRRP